MKKVQVSITANNIYKKLQDNLEDTKDIATSLEEKLKDIIKGCDIELRKLKLGQEPSLGYDADESRDLKNKFKELLDSLDKYETIIEEFDE